MPDGQQQGQFSATDVDQAPRQAGQFTASDVDTGQPTTYQKLTASYNPDVEKFAQNHPIFGPVVRFLDAAGGAAMSTPQGLYNALSQPTETAKQMLQSIEAWKDPNVRAQALSVLPEALGQGVGGAAASEVGGNIAKGAIKAVLPGQGAAARLYQSALKPSTTIPTGQVASMVRTGLEYGIPVSKGGLSKIADLTSDLNDQIAAEIAKAPNRPISRLAVSSRLGDVGQQFSTQVNPLSDLKAVQQAGEEFTSTQPQEIPSEQAQALKQGTYQQLKSRAYGELGTATVEAQKALARGLKEELATAFPELNQLNAADSKLISLQNVLEKSVQRISNHQIGGIGTPIAAAGAKAITGSNAAAAAAGVMKAVFDDPFVKSKLAIALNGASKGQITIPAATARVASYVGALGNASNSQAPGGQPTQ